MGQFQAFLDYSNKGDFKKSIEMDDDTRNIKPKEPLTKNQIDQIYSKYTIENAVDYILDQGKKTE